MDGKSLLYELRQTLNEDDSSGFLDDRTSYIYLHRAAIEFVDRTESLRSSQAFTTTADKKDYILNADFMKLYLRDSEHEFFVKYNDGSNDTFLKFEDLQKIILDNNTTSVSIPGRFTLTDDPALKSRNSGTATSNGLKVAGEAILTDSAGDFSDISTGDVIHNTTDGSDGFVLLKTSGTVLVTSLFSETGVNDWTSGDAYVIQPQGRYQLILDPPPSATGHTVTVECVQVPPIVASDYGTYRFGGRFFDALVKYAAFLYKYRDREVNFGDAWFQVFDRAVRMNAISLNKTLGRQGFKVNFKKRR